MVDRDGSNVQISFGWVSDDGVMSVATGPRDKEHPWPHINSPQKTIRSFKVFGVEYRNLPRHHVVGDLKELTKGPLKVIFN